MPQELKQDLSADQRHLWLQRYVRMKMPTYLSESTDDVLQDVMIKLLKADRSAGQMIDNYGYMKQTVMSVVIDYIRKHKNKGVYDSSFDETTDSNHQVSQSDAPDEVAHQTLLVEQVHQAMGQLSQTRQTTLLLYLRGLKIKEIAHMTGMNIAKVRNEIYRGKNEVLKILNTQGVQYEIQ